MNKSFKRQIFISLMLMVLILFIVLNFSSRQLLEKYYINKRKTEMKMISQKIEATEGPLRVRFLTSSIEDRLGGDVIILDENTKILYSTKSRLSTKKIEENEVLMKRVKSIQRKPGEITYFNREQEDGVAFQLIGLYPTRDGQIIMTQIPLEAIETTLNAMRVFLLMVSVVFLIISIFLSLYISNRIAKPLLILSEKTNKLTEFDFSQDFQSTRSDEIGDLFKNIGKLSQALEEKIEALEDKNVILENEMAIKDDLINKRKAFIANISHELKTPLALIQAYSEGLIDGTFSGSEDEAYYLGVIINETKHMDHLIKELIDLMKLEVKGKAMKKENVLLETLINERLQPFKESLKNKNVLLKKDLNQVSLFIDGDQMAMALRNLIANAIDHVNDKGMILIESQIEDEVLRVSVFNTGKNIPMEDLEDIWEAFYKVDKSRNRQFGGSGIGLSIVKEVFKNHKFDYGVKNLESGVQFYFYVPSDAFTQSS